MDKELYKQAKEKREAATKAIDEAFGGTFNNQNALNVPNQTNGMTLRHYYKNWLNRAASSTY
uniref:Uncharacterized protein n=1 Tax=Nitrosopumivirus cobalaminus TaxID=3158414 RepID=A0AAU7N5W6_9VIRU